MTARLSVRMREYLGFLRSSLRLLLSIGWQLDWGSVCVCMLRAQGLGMLFENEARREARRNARRFTTSWAAVLLPQPEPDLRRTEEASRSMALVSRRSESPSSMIPHTTITLRQAFNELSLTSYAPILTHVAGVPGELLNDGSDGWKFKLESANWQMSLMWDVTKNLKLRCPFCFHHRFQESKASTM